MTGIGKWERKRKIGKKSFPAATLSTGKGLIYLWKIPFNQFYCSFLVTIWKVKNESSRTFGNLFENLRYFKFIITDIYIENN